MTLATEWIIGGPGMVPYGDVIGFNKGQTVNHHQKALSAMKPNMTAGPIRSKNTIVMIGSFIGTAELSGNQAARR